MPWRSVGVGANGRVSFLSWLSVFQCVNAPHLLHPLPVGGHLGGLRVLAAGNDAAGNVGAGGSCSVCFLRGNAQTWMAGPRRRRPVLSVRRSCTLLPTVAAPVHSPTHSARGLPFSLVLASTCRCLSSDHCPSGKGEVTARCGSDLGFPSEGDACHLLTHLSAICASSWGECLLRFSARFNWIVWVFCCCDICVLCVS